jgi:hypothetical protein
MRLNTFHLGYSSRLYISAFSSLIVIWSDTEVGRYAKVQRNLVNMLEIFGTQISDIFAI